MAVTVYAPASMGNVSVGFDLLGAALSPVDGSLLGDRVCVAAGSEGITLQCVGPYQDKLPANPQDNIVRYCAEAFVQRIGQERTPLHLTLEKNLPIGSGLGSSACSIVAALAALNAYFAQPLNQDEMLLLMGELEGQISGSVHYDNVAPSYLGGMQLMLPHRAQTLPSFDHWYWVVAYPGSSLSTAKMRALLPEQIDKTTTIAFGQNLAAFIDASYRQDEAEALLVLKDVLAEPYRADHIPGFQAAKAHLTELGCAAVGISGSGPTLFAVTQSKEQAEQAAVYLQQHYLVNDRGLVHVCQLDNQGVQVWQEDRINAVV